VQSAKKIAIKSSSKKFELWLVRPTNTF